jgi:hypothetical protein
MGNVSNNGLPLLIKHILFQLYFFHNCYDFQDIVKHKLGSADMRGIQNGGLATPTLHLDTVKT